MSFVCPKCERVIYSRRNKTCGFCGQALPAELVFTPAEIEDLKRSETEWAAEHKKKIAELDAEEKARQAAAAAASQ